MKRYDLELTATGPVMEERKEGAYVTFSEVEQLQAKVYALLEERNSTGIAISNAILVGVVPDKHPLRSRLELLANHHKRELMLAELLRRARRYVSPLSCPESEIQIVQSIVSSIDSVLAGQTIGRTLTEDQEFELTTVLQSIANGFSDDPAHDAASMLKRIAGEVPWTGDSFQLPPRQGGEPCASEPPSSSPD
ncbi:hypothetical protein [Aeromonas media]|uniref:hypothetical protein n=1 Tax=Aeromonas media TaxID=651 RepID=UPI00111A5DEF|nr:hypothetical protein [Aeromonas media]